MCPCWDIGSGGWTLAGKQRVQQAARGATLCQGLAASECQQGTTLGSLTQICR